MKMVLTAREPAPVARILLIESGSRHLIDRVVPTLRQHWGNAPIDLLTCFPGTPATLADSVHRVFRVAEYQGRDGRARLYRELGELKYDVAGMICSGEPIMTKWKWVTAWKVPAKFLAINENGDYFWFDVAHRHTLRRFAFERMGLSGSGAGAAFARIVLFPFTLAYLLLYAASAHLKRLVHLALSGAYSSSR